MFAALGSCASMDQIRTRASGCVEFMRQIAHDITSWSGVRDHHRARKDVDSFGDIMALCLDMETHRLHTFTPGRQVPAIVSAKLKKKCPKNAPTTSVRDVLLEGMKMLTEKGLFNQWKSRSMHASNLELDTNEEGGENGIQGEGEDICTDTVFDNPNGRLDVETGLDESEEVAGDVDELEDGEAGDMNDVDDDVESELDVDELDDELDDEF